jgi:hypothetical protein
MGAAGVNFISDKNITTTHHTTTPPLGLTADTRDVGNKADNHDEIKSRWQKDKKMKHV